MTNKTSLYRLISNEFQDLLQVNTVDVMNAISHQIEDIVIYNQLPVDFFAGFQRYSFFHRQRARYERLARVARRVFVFGVPDDDAPNIPGIEYIPLQEDDLLAQEWFLVVNTPQFYTALLTRALEGQDPLTGGRRFEGIWTYDEQIVDRAYLSLTQLLGQGYQPLPQRDYRQQNEYMASMANDLVTRLELNNIGYKNLLNLSKAVNSVNRAVAAQHPLPDLLDFAAANLKANLQAQTVTLWQASSDEMELVGAAGLPGGWREAVYRRQPLSNENLLAARSLQSGQVEYVANAAQAETADIFDPAARTIAAVPLKAQGRLVGSLQLTDPRLNAYSEEALKTLESIGVSLALAIINQSQTALPAGSAASPPSPTPDWSLLEGTLDGVIVLNADKTVAYLNSAARQIFGAPQQNLSGQPLAALDHTELIDVAAKLRPVSSPTYRGQLRVQQRSLLINAAPLYANLESSAPEEVSQWVITIRDETEAGAAGENASSLKTEVGTRLQSIDKLISMLPSLGTVSPTQSETINRVNQINEELRQLLQTGGQPENEENPAGEKAQRLQVVTQGLQHKESVDLQQMLAGLLETFRPAAEGKSIQMQAEISPNLPAFTGDKAQLRQAVSELLENALNYSPAGSKIRLVTGIDKENLIIAVRDNGEGVWLRDVPLLFNPRFRANNEQTQSVSGEGMGLALVKAVAQNHGGQALVESRVGRGSIFLMKLPLQSALEPATWLS